MLAHIDRLELDAGPRSRAVGMERMCAVTREVHPIEDMIRFVVGPGEIVVPDLKRKLPGRGVWVTARRTILAEAVKRGAFQRGFRANVAVPADLAVSVEAQLERAVLDALAIVRKAGAVVTGFGKVEALAETAGAVAFLHASDASPDGVRKIAAAIQRGYGEGAVKVTKVTTFTSAHLDLALGRPNVIHASLLAGRASETFLARWQTLERYRTGDPGGRGAGVKQPEQAAPGLASE